MKLHSTHVVGTIVMLVSFVLAPIANGSEIDFSYTKRTHATSILDTRALTKCEAASLANARCLPASVFLGPHGRLINFRDILWLFGSVGLQGNETVLVIGDNPVERDFVAGLLYVSGQAKVQVLSEKLNPKAMTEGGTARNITREKIFSATMRDQLMILLDELAAKIKAGDALALLDGRKETEYWGKAVRTNRGGHLPGATHLPLNLLRHELKTNQAVLPSAPAPIAYGHNAQQGFTYFTLLRAGAGIDARIFPGGWAEWAENSTLPADSVTYPDQTEVTQNLQPNDQGNPYYEMVLIVIGTFIGGILTALGLLMAKRKTT